MKALNEIGMMLEKFDLGWPNDSDIESMAQRIKMSCNDQEISVLAGYIHPVQSWHTHNIRPSVRILTKAFPDFRRSVLLTPEENLALM